MTHPSFMSSNQSSNRFAKYRNQRVKSNLPLIEGGVTDAEIGENYPTAAKEGKEKPAKLKVFGDKMDEKARLLYSYRRLFWFFSGPPYPDSLQSQDSGQGEETPGNNEKHLRIETKKIHLSKEDDEITHGKKHAPEKGNLFVSVRI